MWSWFPLFWLVGLWRRCVFTKLPLSQERNRYWRSLVFNVCLGVRDYLTVDIVPWQSPNTCPLDLNNYITDLHPEAFGLTLQGNLLDLCEKRTIQCDRSCRRAATGRQTLTRVSGASPTLSIVKPHTELRSNRATTRSYSAASTSSFSRTLFSTYGSRMLSSRGARTFFLYSVSYRAQQNRTFHRQQ